MANGEIPDPPIGAPGATAITNRDGSSRAVADLTGTPTILWFYPVAATGG